MRTTLDIDDDLLSAAKEIARREKSSAGQVVSRLLRKSLTGEVLVAPKAKRKSAPPAVADFSLLRPNRAC